MRKVKNPPCPIGVKPDPPPRPPWPRGVVPPPPRKKMISKKEELAAELGKAALRIWEKLPDCSVEFRNNVKNEKLIIIAHLPHARGNWFFQRLISFHDIQLSDNLPALFKSETDLIIKHLEIK